MKAKNSEIREEGVHVGTMWEPCGKFGKSFHIFPTNDLRMWHCQAILDKIARKNTTFTREIATLRQRLRDFPEGNASCVDRSGIERGAELNHCQPSAPRCPEDLEECFRVQPHLGWNSSGRPLMSHFYKMGGATYATSNLLVDMF